MLKRNGQIELLRFLFSLCVFFFHVELTIYDMTPSDVGFTFFAHGNIAVEFFFLLSGCLMAKTVSKELRNKKEGVSDIPTDTFHFIKKKYVSVFKYSLFSFLMIAVTTTIRLESGAEGFFKYVLTNIPTLFMINMTGINVTGLNIVTWYISVMLFSMLILYPLLKKNYNAMTKIVMPIIVLITLGYLVKNYGSLSNTSVWTEYGYKSAIRGFAEIALGVIVYEVATYIKNRDFSKIQKIALFALEIAMYAIAFLFIVSNHSSKYEVLILFAIAVGLILTFSEVNRVRFFDNKIIYFLGKISLPFYLCHIASIDIARKYLLGMSKPIVVLLCFVISVVLSLICMWIGDFFYKQITRKNKKIVENNLIKE